jgi:septum formation inhibitor MinC
MANGEAGSPRARQRNRQERVADELGIDPSQVGVRDTLNTGTRATLTSDGVGAAEQAARSRVAESADYVQSDDVAADVGRRDFKVSARVADREDVEQRAERQFASASEFINPSDVDADVGERGVSDLGLQAERQDDVKNRVEGELLSQLGESARASDISVSVTDAGIQEAGLKDGAAKEIAARDFQSEFGSGEVDPDRQDLQQFIEANFDEPEELERGGRPPSASPKLPSPPSPIDGPVDKAAKLRRAVRSGGTVDADNFPGIEDVEIGVGDVERAGDGFGLDSEAQRRVAADQIEESTPLSAVDPVLDVEQTDEGFGLAGSAQRRFAAEQFEEQTVIEEINPNTGLTRTDDGFGLSTPGQRQLAAQEFEEQTELSEVDPQQDILLNDDGSATLADQTEKELAAELLDQQVDADVGVGDIDRVTDPGGDTEFEFVGGGR